MSNLYWPNTTASNVGGGGNTAISLIKEKFATAQDYAEDAWSRVFAILAAIAAITPEFPPITDLTFDIQSTIVDTFDATKPEAPLDSDLSFVDPGRPTLGALQDLPSFYLPGSSIETSKDLFMSRVLAILTKGSTGLDETIEAALWTRAIARQELEGIRLYNEAEKYHSSRGFSLPPGALSGKLNEIAIEIARNNANLSLEISIKQAELAQANDRFVMNEAFSQVLKMEEQYALNVLNANKNVVEAFVAEVEEYKFLVAAQVSRIEAVLKSYLGKIEAYKADATVAGIRLDAQIKVIDANIKQAQLKVDVALKNAEIMIEEAKIKYGLQVEALKASGMIAAQIAASALSSVNASASLGFSAGASMSVSSSEGESWDNTKSDKTFSYQEQTLVEKK